MPYINQEKREVLVPHITDLLNALRELESDDERNSTGGNLNFIITSLLVAIYGEGRYDDRAEAISVLECAKLEFYRRHVVPYEDQKQFEHGDVVAVTTPQVLEEYIIHTDFNQPEGC